MNSHQSRQQKHYDHYAAVFEETENRANSNHFYKIESILQAIQSRLNASTPLRILELGAGTGIHANYLARNLKSSISRFVLFDISQRMLDGARAKMSDLPFVEFAVGAAEAPKLNGPFDVIYLSGALHHVSDPSKVVESASKLLRPGGLLLVCEPVGQNPINFAQAILDVKEWGQFRVRPRTVVGWMEAAGLRTHSTRFLHYRAGSHLVRRIWNYRSLEKWGLFNWLAIMFLAVAEKPSTASR